MLALMLARDMDKSRENIKDGVYDETIRLGSKAVYQSWADKYDTDNAALGFRLPMLAAGFVARYVSADASILDAGAGTGLVGASLKVLGYDQIEAIDISQEMLDQAAKTGAYQNLGVQVLG